MKKSKILVVLYPGCIFLELALALELLAKNHEIFVITPDGKYHIASNGLVLCADGSYSSANLNECVGLLVPGGDPGSIVENKDIENLIQTANKKQIIIAAICAGPFILAKSGILKGKRIAHGYEKKQLDFLESYFSDVILTKEKVIIDGNIITAKPDAHIDFAVEIAVLLGVFDGNKASHIKEYYRGIL